MIETTRQLQEKDNQILHPWEDISSLDKNQRTVVTSGDGVYVTDTDGNKLLDGPAGMWCINIGHQRQEMADAISQQVMQLTYNSPWSLANSPAANLATKLAQLSPADLNHVFFTTCGSTAVDSALRFVMFRNNVLGKPEKKHIISRTNAYHGSTYLSASASGKARDKNYLDCNGDLFHHIADPSLSNKPDEMTEEAYCDLKVQALEDKIKQLGQDKVAAFIAEPIQASGGVLLAPQNYHQKCLTICRKYDVLYISDEIVTAFGRLGHFFASQEVFGITPDIITCAKGLTSGYLPMGAFLVSDRILQDIKEKPDAVFANGFTYSGHPVTSAAALKNIEIIEREEILEHVREIAPYFQQQLATLKSLSLVADVRGMGLMACVECHDPQNIDHDLSRDYHLGDKIDQHCQKLGLLVRPIINMCVISPPLIINRSQIDEITDKLHQGIKHTMHELGV